MTAPLRTTSELQQARASHLGNIARLEQIAPRLAASAAQRLDTTLRNLHNQVRDIDAELAQLRKERRRAGRAA